MGGTFDPVHNGHLVAASEVADLFDLDEVVFVPTGQPWQKNRFVTPAEDRYLMTVIATAANPRFSVSRVDIDRGGPTYTRDTLRDLRALNPEADLYFITGADALASILTWQDWEEMFALAKFVGVSRPGYELDGAHIEKALKEMPDDALRLVEVLVGDLVDRLSQARQVGRPIWYLVPDGVVQYVSKRGFYQSPVVLAQDQRQCTASDEAIEMATVAARASSAKLADDVVVIDVSGQLVITDCFVIASASNERQVNAIIDEVEEKMRVAGYKPARREGAREGRWTLLDYVDIVVHIQHQDERNFYALDRLWRDCPIVPVDLDAGGGTMRVRRLVMLRHGQTDFNAGNRMQGQLDTELSDLGRDQAVAAAGGAGEAAAAADRVVGPTTGAGHRGGSWRAVRHAGGGGHPPARDASRGLARHDTSRSRCIGARCATGMAQRRDVGTARRREPGRRGGARNTVGRGAGRRSNRMGGRRSRAASGDGGAWRPDRRADGGAAEAAIEQSPHWADRRRQLGAAVLVVPPMTRTPTISGRGSTYRTPRHRSPTMSSESPGRCWSSATYQRHATTAGATPAELADAYREALRQSGGDGVVAVHISAALSSTYSSAAEAAREFGPAVRVVNSRSAAMGVGFVALAAAQQAASRRT